MRHVVLVRVELILAFLLVHKSLFLVHRVLLSMVADVALVIDLGLGFSLALRVKLDHLEVWSRVRVAYLLGQLVLGRSLLAQLLLLFMQFVLVLRLHLL